MTASGPPSGAPLAGQLARLISAQPGAGDAQVTSVRGQQGGAARDLYFFDARWRQGGAWRAESCVLLRSREAGCLDTSRRQEFDVLQALSRRHFPVPAPLWVDQDGEWLDYPSVILRFVSGDAQRSALDGYGAGARAGVDRDVVAVLARLHALEWPPAELPFLERPAPEAAAAAQLDLWEQAYRKAAAGGEPGLTAALCWLRYHLPVASRVCLLHGDYRYGNLLFDATGITAVVDWELAHFGDPAEDLIWPFRAFRRNTAPLAPWPEFLAAYGSLTGTVIHERNWHFYRVLSAVKTAIICLSARASIVGGGTNDIVNGHMALNVGYHTEQALRWIDEIEQGPAA